MKKENSNDLKKLILSTKKDIVSLVTKSIDELAHATAQGFTDVYKRFDRVDERFDKMEKEMNSLQDEMRNRFNGVNERIDDHAFNRATKDEVYLLKRRVDRIETKVGLKHK